MTGEVNNLQVKTGFIGVEESCGAWLSGVALRKVGTLMDAETRKQLTLVKDEWELVLELLERERKELHAEIQSDRLPRLSSEAVATARSGGPAPKDSWPR